MPAKHAGGGHYEVFQYDPFDKSLVMDVALWRELSLMGSWIRDATILRWAEQTEVFAKGAVKASLVIDRLLLAPDQGRNVNEAQRFFAAFCSSAFRRVRLLVKVSAIRKFIVQNAMLAQE
jgi:hypothetical protein